MAEARIRGGILAVVAALALAACSGSATPAPSNAPASQAPAASASGPRLGATAGPASGAKAAIDETLLKYLPAAVGSLTVSYSAEATQGVVGDAGLVTNAIAVAYGIAADSTSGDFVVAAVVRLKDGVFSDSFYRSWRGTYDTGACVQAGGIAGNAEAQIGGRTVSIGTCAGGAHTYHVYLDKLNVLISATSVGSKRFGEQLMGTLRP